MERGICTSHKDKHLECFCWDCQSIVCQFCMQEHAKRQHKVFSLRTLSKYTNSPKKQELKQSEPESIPIEVKKEEVSPASKPAVEAPVKKPPKPETEYPCMKCGEPADPTLDITLSCTHCAHQDCLKE